jgi:general transcriptional corepressor CYC8
MEDQRRAAEEQQRRADDMRRAEEQRHSDGYHPSEAAHHPPSHSMPPNHLPPMQQAPGPMQNILHDGPPSGPAPKDYPPADERQNMDHPPAPRPPPMNEPERAARKVEVDEDYDDSGEDEKKAGIAATNGSGPTSAAAELKTSTPTSAGINGMMATAPKVES